MTDNVCPMSLPPLPPLIPSAITADREASEQRSSVPALPQVRRHRGGVGVKERPSGPGRCGTGIRAAIVPAKQQGRETEICVGRGLSSRTRR